PSKFSANPKQFPKLKIAFLDLAGEDLKKIKVSEGGEFNSKINSVFKGIEIEESELIFLLITPFDPAPGGDETKANAHNREDTLHSDFLNFVETNRPQLFNRCGASGKHRRSAGQGSEIPVATRRRLSR
ncbi:MAG: hypothetical protein ACKOXO_07555, partial [Cyanobium sp.]